MTTWWHYLLLANLYLVLFYAFYALLLRRETFFQLNRIYLMAASALSFLLPVIQLDWVKHWFITERVEQTIYQADPGRMFEITAMPDNSLTLGNVLGYVYLLGLLYMIVKLVLQLKALRRLLKQPESGTAYSFFNIIQVDTGLPEHDLITAHEQAHSSQWHSADRLLVELLLIVNWFNPVVYLYRRALKHLHEFIADQQVLRQGASRRQYAQLLVSQAFHIQPHHLSSSFFNKSLLKQRIMMLQKDKSKRVALVKYGLSAPLFAAMLVLSSATLSKNRFITTINGSTEHTLAMPANQLTNFKQALALSPGGVQAQKNDKAVRTQSVAPQFNTANSDDEKVMLPANSRRVTDTIPEGGNEVFTQVETAPEFPGGVQAFYNYLGRSIHYPDAARKAGVQGRVIVQFIVEKDGSLSNVKSLRGPGSGIDEEAVRAIAASPRWTPARQNNKLVRVQYTVPVQFTLPGVKQSQIKAGTPVNITGVSTDTTKRGLITTTKHPLYVLDGKIITEAQLQAINPDDIKSIDVHKDKTTTDAYGEKGADGVVFITLKNKQ